MSDNSGELGQHPGGGRRETAARSDGGRKQTSETQRRYIGVGIALGVSIGIGLSLVLDSWAYMGVGLALGVVFGVSFGQQNAASIARDSAPDGDDRDLAPGASPAADDPRL